MSRTAAALANNIRPSDLHEIIAIAPHPALLLAGRFRLRAVAREELRKMDSRLNFLRCSFGHYRWSRATHGRGVEILRGFAI
jgi:hypothetical protein